MCPEESGDVLLNMRLYGHTGTSSVKDLLGCILHLKLTNQIYEIVVT